MARRDVKTQEIVRRVRAGERILSYEIEPRLLRYVRECADVTFDAHCRIVPVIRAPLSHRPKRNPDHVR